MAIDLLADIEPLPQKIPIDLLADIEPIKRQPIDLLADIEPLPIESEIKQVIQPEVTTGEAIAGALGTPVDTINSLLKTVGIPTSVEPIGGKEFFRNIGRFGEAFSQAITGQISQEEFKQVQQETGINRFIDVASDISAVALLGIFTVQGIQGLVNVSKIARSQFGDLSPTIRAFRKGLNQLSKTLRLSGADKKIITDIIKNPDKFTGSELARLARTRPTLKKFLISRVGPRTGEQILQPIGEALPGLGQLPARIQDISKTRPLPVDVTRSFPTVPFNEHSEILKVINPITLTGEPERVAINISDVASQPQTLNQIQAPVKGEEIEIPAALSPDIPKPPATGAGSEALGGPPDEPIDQPDINAQYEVLKDHWLGEKDWQGLKASVESNRIRAAIQETTGEKRFGERAQDIDKAIQIFIDTKRDPSILTKETFAKLTPEDRRIAFISQNLTPQQRAIAQDISNQYSVIGGKAQDAEIIQNVLDNYVARVWDVVPPKQPSQVGRKFGTTTRHAKARTFKTILEGQAAGFKLKKAGASNNLNILKEEIHNTIQDKKFLKDLMSMRDVDGNPFLSTKQLPGYKRVEHPNFKVWRFAGQAEPQDPQLQGKNFLQTPEGTILERKEIYAPEKVAQNLNNMMGVSKLRGIKGIDAITRFNAVAKGTILTSSLFHHLAFMRSFYLGSSPFAEAGKQALSGSGFIKSLNSLTPRQSFQSGLQSIYNLIPELELGVRNGLTLGLVRDWEESILRDEESTIGRTLDKLKVTKDIKDKVVGLWRTQTDFLFGQFGAGLKAKAFLIEFRNLMRDKPDMDPNKAARIVANAMNDDFGGLHLKRLGRNPTTQHIFRLFALAADWTESNIRLMVKAFKRGDEGEFYRRMWARIITKGVFATLAANAVLHTAKDTKRTFEKAWENGKLRWLDVDVTPIKEAVVGKETNTQKYFSILGHFKDPLKFAVDPIKSAEYKGSPVFRIIFDAITGQDWADRHFTELDELIATGKTVRPFFTFAGKPQKWKTIPSFVINHTRGVSPIPVQNLLSWWAGEMEGFDAVANSLGLGVRTTFEKSPQQKKEEKATRKAIRRLRKKK